MESLEQEKRQNWEIFKKAVKARKASKEGEKEDILFHIYGVQICTHLDEQGRPDALIMYTNLWEEISFSKHTIIVECDIGGAVGKRELISPIGLALLEGSSFLED